MSKTQRICRLKNGTESKILIADFGERGPLNFIRINDEIYSLNIFSTLNGIFTNSEAILEYTRIEVADVRIIPQSDVMHGTL